MTVLIQGGGPQTVTHLSVGGGKTQGNSKGNSQVRYKGNYKSKNLGKSIYSQSNWEFKQGKGMKEQIAQNR